MSWYHIPGNDQDVAVSTRVRLARNLAGVPFTARLDAAGAREVIRTVGTVLTKNGFVATDFADISGTAAKALVEKRWISPAFATASHPHALFLNEPCNLAVMVCAEDHVTIQCILPGLAVGDGLEGVLKVERLLDSHMELAFSEKWGYLTASPADLGSALRCSVLLSLPMLAASGRLEGMRHGLCRGGLWLRGPLGEDDSPFGHLYQLTNRVTLGSTEEETASTVMEAAEGLILSERRVRDSITGEELSLLTDRVRRAEGILRYGHMLSVQEMPHLLGLMRTGAAMGIVKGVRVETITALLSEAMPACLISGMEVPPKGETEKNIFRAQLVRRTLFGEDSSGGF